MEINLTPEELATLSYTVSKEYARWRYLKPLGSYSETCRKLRNRLIYYAKLANRREA